MRSTVASLRASADSSQAELHELGRSLTDKETRLAAALTRSAALEVQLRERNAALERASASADEHEHELQQLRARSAVFDRGMNELMAQVSAAMAIVRI